MGYSYEMFADIERLSLPKGGRVLDLGSQDIFLAEQDHLDKINRFIELYGGVPLPHSVLGTTIEVREIWANAGFDYRCIDVDERPETIRVDLQNFSFPSQLRNAFDLVTNMGTTEHLASPMVGLALMHYACKQGGALFSDVPIFGWGNHGLANLTPKFWHQLRFINGYETVACSLRQNDESTVDPGNFFHGAMDYMEDLTEARGISWMIRFVAISRNGGAFIPPFDALLPNSDGSKEADIMMGLLRPFLLARIWTRTEAIQAINDGIARLGKPYRIPDNRFLLLDRMKIFARKCDTPTSAARALEAAIRARLPIQTSR